MLFLTEIKIALNEQRSWDYYLIDDRGIQWECNTFDSDVEDHISCCRECGTDFEEGQDIFFKKDRDPLDEEPHCRKCVTVVPLNEMRAAWKIQRQVVTLHQRIAARRSG